MVAVVVLSPSFSSSGLLLGLILVWGFRVNRDGLGWVLVFWPSMVVFWPKLVAKVGLAMGCC